uniref:peptide chain release factor N(5)-glutamine methyltransferase n=1 Tax=Cacopsylla melanoneura TaxID=428564 RepID=A0A8D8PNC6_9HEMI
MSLNKMTVLKNCVVLVLSLQKRTLASSTNLVGNVMKEWTGKFEKANIPEPKSSIRNIMAHVMNNSKVDDLLADQDSELSEAQISSLNKLCECRLARMPVQYIIKEWDFRDLTLKMVPPVFIPRSETEELIDIIADKFATPPSRMIEIGSGTGAISIALLKQFPGLKGIAIDLSKHACDLTHENAVAHGVSNNLQIINTEIDNKGQIKNFPTELLKEKFDLIVSNPPYIPSLEIPKLQPEISLYEDLKALDGGHDGLHVIKPICVFGSNHLKPDGSIFLETNHDHLEQIKGWLDVCKGHMKLKLEESYKDFNDKDRFVQLKLIK